MSKKNYRPRTKARSSRQQGKSMLIPIVVAVVVVAMIAGIIISIEGGMPSLANSSQGNTALPLNTGSLPYPDVPRISLEESQAKLEQGQALLIDVRSRDSFDKSHAAGAISIPEEEIVSRLDELPRDKEIILYCTWGQEQQSARVAQNLMSRGFNNVSALSGGFAAWQRAGLPTESTTP